MSTLRTLQDKDLAKVVGGGPSGLAYRRTAAFTAKPIVGGDVVQRDPKTSALCPKWRMFGI